MRSTVAQSVGVDISKDTLDVAIHPGGESFRVTNNPEGHRALIKRLKGFDIDRIVFEATGAYDRRSTGDGRGRLALGQGQSLSGQTLRPGHGKLAKTDRCDAIMLARMTTRPAQSQRLRPTPSHVANEKKVEMLFAYLKRILRLDRLRLRGPSGAKDEFLLAATAQNLRKLAKLIPLPTPLFAT